ncbi:response regulator [Chlorogloeopsis sp. ULAP01]|uniref:response regulator n=1 Tax=Chlorogloeopsis sp. ULAP01 TaxID=3056483 RepID=UPI0025AAF2F1|nr:response regulator [Chlorogloeopsis sp. ULAP01]MDM9383096.1 response regulator [Chlorogloeopsis sp. ULAP01]
MTSDYCENPSIDIHNHFRHTITSQALSDLRVIVVDNNLDSLELVRFIFEPYNTQVVLAKTTSEALEKIPQLQPNILISEIFLPDEDGYSLIRQLRNIKGKLAQIPAIALTTLTYQKAIKLAFNAGFSNYMAKPFNPDALVELVSILAIKQVYDVLVSTEESNIALVP